MEFTVKAISETRINVTEGSDTIGIIGSIIDLEVPAELNPRIFFDEKGVVTIEGVEMLTMILVSGLAANVHCAADAGLWDRAAHMRHIFSTLEDLFVAQGENVDKKNL